MKNPIILLSILIWSNNLLAEDIPGKTLLSYFSGSCKSSSQWTQTAIADSEALVSSLNAMIKDEDCAGAAGAISQLNGLNAQLAVLNRMNETKNKIATYNAEEQQLLIQLTSTSDPAVMAEINASLRFLQIERAKLLSKQKTAEEISGSDKVEILAQVAQSANSSFQQITANEKCLEKHPSLLNSATSIMAGVGSAVTMLNPAIGISLTAGSTFTKVGLDGIRNSRHARRIRKITDSTISFEAYSCALESMAERWCQMRDAEAFLKFKARRRRVTEDHQDLSQAITLNDREIPALLDWLNKIRNGVASENTAAASRRSNVLARELIVRTRGDTGLSLIEQSRRTYNSLSKPEDQWSFLRTIIISLTPNREMYGQSSGPSDPFNDIYSSAYSPFYLLGLAEDDERIRKDCNGLCTFSDWSKPAEVVVTLEDVKEKYEDWIKRAENLVNRELSDVQQPDPRYTFASAKLESEPWMVSPLTSLHRIIEFLETNPPGERQEDFKNIYKDTIKKLQTIHDVATVAILTDDMSGQYDGEELVEDESKLTPIEKVSQVAQLKYGVVVLQARLEMIVRISLLEHIRSRPDEDQVFVAQLLASDRFYETISRMSGTTSFASLMQDIRTGQAYTMKNLISFMDIFGHNINRALKKLYFEEKRSSPTVARANRDLRTSMCFLALGAANVREHIDLRYCEGLKMEALQLGGPETLTIDRNTFDSDLGNRACAYREYFRQSDIFQKWGIKN